MAYYGLLLLLIAIAQKCPFTGAGEAKSDHVSSILSTFSIPPNYRKLMQILTLSMHTHSLPKG